MPDVKNSESERIPGWGFYVFMGLAFLFWENLISSILGIYHFELRRTIWGVIYYVLVFLLLGGIVEIIVLISNRLLPRSRWYGKKYFWLLSLLVIIFGKEPIQKLVFIVFNVHSGRVINIISILLVPVLLVFVFSADIVAAKLRQKGKLASRRRLLMLFITSVLYIIVSKKLDYHFYAHDVASFVPLVLQPVYIIGSLAAASLLLKLFSSDRALRRALLILPVLFTIVSVAVSTALKPHPPVRVAIQQPPNEHPNIVIMLFDAMRADHLLGSRRDTTLTPAINQLARESKVYHPCYSTSSWTFPSVVSLLTSTLPNKLGLLDKGYIPEKTTTVATVLKRNGYYTVGLSANDLITPRYGFDRSFDEFHYVPSVGPLQMFYPYNTKLAPVKFVQELAYQMGFITFTAVAADWHKMDASASNILDNHHNAPLFLYIHYLEPHGPYYTKPFRGGILDLKMLTNPIRWYLARNLSEEEKTAIIEEVIGEMHERYLNGVACADSAVADILNSLDEFGMAKNTVIIVMADHGEEFGEHGGWDHWTTLYEESINIPLIIYIPPSLGINLPDQSTAVSIMDIAPTVVDLAGIHGENFGVDGWSLMEPYPDNHRSIYLMLKKVKYFRSAHISDPYKLILTKTFRTEKVDTSLFNLKLDPGEKDNLYPQDRYIADSLAVGLQEQVDQSLDEQERIPVKLSPKEVERLRALGYTN